MLKRNLTTTPYAFPELQWVKTIIFAIAILAASHFSQSTRTSLIEFALITLARKWEVCGQLTCIVYDGNQVFVFATYQAIKIWIKINGTFDSCIIPNIGLKIRTVKTALWHLMLEEVIRDWGRTSSRGISRIWKNVNTQLSSFDFKTYNELPF